MAFDKMAFDKIAPIFNPHTKPPMNIEQARFNMIEQQIRTWDVLDTEILDLLQVVRR